MTYTTQRVDYPLFKGNPLGKIYVEKSVLRVKKGHCIKAHHDQINKVIDLLYVRRNKDQKHVNEVLYDTDALEKAIKQWDDAAERAERVKQDSFERGHHCIVMDDPSPVAGETTKYRVRLLHCTTKASSYQSSKICVPIPTENVTNPISYNIPPVELKPESREMPGRPNRRITVVSALQAFEIVVNIDSAILVLDGFQVSENGVKQIATVEARNQETELVRSLQYKLDDEQRCIDRARVKLEALKNIAQLDREIDQKEALKQLKKEDEKQNRDKQRELDALPDQMKASMQKWAALRKQSGEKSEPSQHAESASADTNSAAVRGKKFRAMTKKNPGSKAQE